MPKQEQQPVTEPAADGEPTGGPSSETPANGAATQPTTVAPGPVRLCPKCSTQSQTTGEFCPQCGARFDRRGRLRRASRRTKIVLGTIVLLLLAGGGATAAVLKINHDNSVTAKNQRDQREARARAAQQTADQAAADAQRTEQIALRQGIVSDLQSSITKDAKKDVDQGLLTGSIMRTVCTPVGGGSTDDLTAHTANFSCTAVNKDNGDGSYEGYRFSATVNYDDASYSWHLGG